MDADESRLETVRVDRHAASLVDGGPKLLPIKHRVQE